MSIANKRIAVLGAGFQGACVALELAGRGATVDLYERNPVCLSEAASNNEGKIHLGFVYANDRTFGTAKVMSEGAFAFETALTRWLGSSAGRLPVSEPFIYAVHRESLLSAETYEAYAFRVSEHLNSVAGGRPYFGRNPQRPPERLSDTEQDDLYQRDDVVAAYRTEEIAIDPVVLTDLVRQRLDEDSRIRCLTGRNVEAAENLDTAIRIRFLHEGQSETETYDYAINTSWASRLRIDEQAGLHPLLPWSHRLKYYVRGQSNAGRSLPSTTFVLGPFGDVVDYKNGLIFMSWYPAGLTEWSSATAAPSRPARLMNGDGDAIRNGTFSGLSRLMPGIDDLDRDACEVRGNWIFAWGETDIDDPASLLHQRFQIGVRTLGRYMTIDTGKLTMAPLYAQRAADLLC